MWFRLLTFVLLLLPVPAMAGVKEDVAALAPADSRMVHIVGVNQATVVGLRR